MKKCRITGPLWAHTCLSPSLGRQLALWEVPQRCHRGIWPPQDLPGLAAWVRHTCPSQHMCSSFFSLYYPLLHLVHSYTWLPQSLSQHNNSQYAFDFCSMANSLGLSISQLQIYPQRKAIWLAQLNFISQFPKSFSLRGTTIDLGLTGEATGRAEFGYKQGRQW